MYLLDNFGKEPKQNITWTNDNVNNDVEFYFEYKTNQLGWFMSFKYGERIFNNIRLTTNPNLLRAYSSYLPFGLMCLTSDGLEPMSIDDFYNGYARLYVLTQEECKQVEDSYYAQISA